MSVRGELRIVGFGHRGYRRLERPDVGELLGTLVQAPDMEALLIDPGVLQAVLPPMTTAEGPGTGEEMKVRLLEGPVVIRRFASETARGLPRRSGAAHAHATAHSLRALGIGTPAVLGYAEPERDSGPSWLVSRFIDAPTLGELRDAGVFGDPSVRRRCVLAVAEVLSRLHRGGFVHGRLDPDRMLVEESQVLLLDPGSVRRGGVRQQRAELVRLGSAFELRDIGPIERGHFLKRYVGRVPEASSTRLELARTLTRV